MSLVLARTHKNVMPLQQDEGNSFTHWTEIAGSSRREVHLSPPDDRRQGSCVSRDLRAGVASGPRVLLERFAASVRSVPVLSLFASLSRSSALRSRSVRPCWRSSSSTSIFCVRRSSSSSRNQRRRRSFVSWAAKASVRSRSTAIEDGEAERLRERPRERERGGGEEGRWREHPVALSPREARSAWPCRRPER